MTVQEAYYGSAATATVSGLIAVTCLVILITHSPTILKMLATILGAASLVGFGMSVAVAMKALERVSAAKIILARNIERRVPGTRAEVLANGMDEDVVRITRSKDGRAVAILPFEDARIAKVLTRSSVRVAPSSTDELYRVIAEEMR